MKRSAIKFYGSLLLVPLAALFLLCCCLNAEATPTKKSSCSSCPQKEKSSHQDDCPHAKIKAVIDSLAFSLENFKVSIIAVIDIKYHLSFLASFRQNVFQPLGTSQYHSFLDSQNLILRV